MKVIICITFLVSSQILFSQPYWKTSIHKSTLWNVFNQDTLPNENWKQCNLGNNDWINMYGGIGYGDNDDFSTIDTALVIYIRTTFYIDDLDDIFSGLLHADYDDGFIAYINGYEIARSANIVSSNVLNDFGQSVIQEHEAKIYQNGLPEGFLINEEIIESVLQNGENCLAIQVINYSNGMDDMTANFWLSFSHNQQTSGFMSLWR